MVLWCSLPRKMFLALGLITDVPSSWSQKKSCSEKFHIHNLLTCGVIFFWLVVGLPLWKIWVRQLRNDYSPTQYFWENKIDGNHSPPTSFCFHCSIWNWRLGLLGVLSLPPKTWAQLPGFQKDYFASTGKDDWSWYCRPSFEPAQEIWNACKILQTH